ncbi:MAG: DUF4832 domain-containing protein [Pseudomonadota bacterium]
MYPFPALPSLKPWPGVQGWGTDFPTSFVGAQIVPVLNLNDSGPGSLRAAITTPGTDPIIVLILVSGSLLPLSQLYVTHPRTLIVGDLSPGGFDVESSTTNGDSCMAVHAQEVYIRQIGFRGNAGPVTPGGWCCKDAFNFDRIGNNNVHHAVLHHCSIQWGSDELLDSYYANDLTVDHCLISEGLTVSTGNSGPAGRGPLMSYGARVTFHHCGFLFIGQRLPQFQTIVDYQGVNNVVHHFTWGPGIQNLVSGSVLPGNITGSVFSKPTSTWHHMNIGLNEPGTIQLYESGNVAVPQWGGTQGPVQILDAFTGATPTFTYRVANPNPAPTITEHSTAELEQYIYDNAGVTVPQRNPNDTRVLNNWKNNTGDYIDCVDGQTPTAENSFCSRDATRLVIPATPQVFDSGEPDYIPANVKALAGHAAGVNTMLEDSNNDGTPDWVDMVNAGWLHSAPVATTTCIDTADFDIDGLRAACRRRVFVPPTITGTTRTASSLSAFNSALAASSANDAIQITGGPHAWGTLQINNNDLTIFGGTFTGATAFDVRGSRNTFHSIRCQSMSKSGDVNVDTFNSSAIFYFKSGAHDNRFLNNEVDGYGNGGNQYALITTAANNLEVADSLFQGGTVGSFAVAVNAGTAGGGTGYHIHHNEFHGTSYVNSFGGEAIRLGLLGNATNAIVEYNWIEGWENDNETLDNKGSGSIIRYNLLENNGPDSFCSGRVGSNNIYYGNAFLDVSLGNYDNGSNNVWIFNYIRRHSAPLYGDICFYLFAQTPGVPSNNNPPEPGSKNAIIRYNVCQGFTKWLGTNEQFPTDGMIAGPSGATITDNYFLAMTNTDAAAGYQPDQGTTTYPYSTWLENNNAPDNSELNTINGTEHCGSEVVDFPPLTIGGVTYMAPFWWTGALVGTTAPPVTPPPSSGTDQVVTTTEFQGLLPTRDQGFASFASSFFDGDLHPDRNGEFPWGFIYYRDDLASMWPSENTFDWSGIDATIAKAQARGVSVLLSGPMMELGTSNSYTPQWLKDKAGVTTLPLLDVNGITHRAFDWSSSTLRGYAETFMAAFAARYNGHPDICAIDIRWLGRDGEWQSVNTFDVPNWTTYFPNKESQEYIFNQHELHFPDTPLIALMGQWNSAYDDVGSTGNTNSSERADGNGTASYCADLASARGIGLRADGYGQDANWGADADSHTRRYSVAYQQAHPNLWKAGRIDLETLYDFNGLANGSPSGQFSNWLAGGTDYISAFDDAVTWHATSIHNKNGDIPSSFRPKLTEIFKKLGARYWFKRVAYSDAISAGTNMVFTCDIENTGVAPEYRDYRATVRFKDSSGQVVEVLQSDYSLKGRLPGEHTGQVITVAIPSDTSLQSGNSYTMEMGLTLRVGSAQYLDRTKPIASSGAGTANGGWLSLTGGEVGDGGTPPTPGSGSTAAMISHSVFSFTSYDGSPLSITVPPGTPKAAITVSAARLNGASAELSGMLANATAFPAPLITDDAGSPAGFQPAVQLYGLTEAPTGSVAIQPQGTVTGFDYVFVVSIWEQVDGFGVAESYFSGTRTDNSYTDTISGANGGVLASWAYVNSANFLPLVPVGDNTAYANGTSGSAGLEYMAMTAENESLHTYGVNTAAPGTNHTVLIHALEVYGEGAANVSVQPDSTQHIHIVDKATVTVGAVTVETDSSYHEHTAGNVLINKDRVEPDSTYHEHTADNASLASREETVTIEITHGVREPIVFTVKGQNITVDLMPARPKTKVIEI